MLLCRGIPVASLKEQWKREIERFTDERAVVVAGTSKERAAIYREDDPLFKITNYRFSFSRYRHDFYMP